MGVSLIGSAVEFTVLIPEASEKCFQFLIFLTQFENSATYSLVFIYNVSRANQSDSQVDG